MPGLTDDISTDIRDSNILQYINKKNIVIYIYFSSIQFI